MSDTEFVKYATRVKVSVAGEAREIEIDSYLPLDEAHNAHPTEWGLFVARIGLGAARYPTNLILFPVREGHPHHRGNEITTDTEGRKWQYHLGTCVRNRQATIVGWADVAGVTNYADQTRA